MTVVTAVDAMAPDVLRSRAVEILEYDSWPRERLLELQRARLRRLLEHAVAHSPYYRDALGPDAADADLAALPTLPKQVLLDEFDRIVTDRRLRSSDLERFVADADAGADYLATYRVFSTSGTTGVPGLFVYTHDEFAHWVSVSLAAFARLGVTAETRLLAIGAPDPIHITRQLFAAFHTGREGVPRLVVTTPLEVIVEALNDYQPEAMLSYPSVLGDLAEQQLEGRLAIAPRVVVSTSEVLTEDAARRMEDAWGIRPMSAYAATEAVPLATGSPEHVGMHVCEHSLVLEVVDAENRPVEPGEPGAKVLLTNLVNQAQPLIRYELTDSVVLADGPDPSGRPFLRIVRVDGRGDDTLQLPAAAGGKVAVNPFRLRAPFVRLHDVRQYQIVHRPGTLLARIVPREGSPPDLPDRVRSAVAAALAQAGAAIPVDVEVVGGIAREPGPAAKVKLVRSGV